MPSSRAPRIDVVGAGPGGLICARILQRHGAAVTVHDLDTSATARDQGGSLDMHPGTGQHALKEAGLWDAFAPLSRPEGQQIRVADRHGQLLLDAAPPEEGDGADVRPEIDRGRLRHLLLNSLSPGTVRWGHRLERAEPLGDGVHRLHFADGSTTETDLVIGADGAWSRVRPLVSGARPDYTGVTVVEAELLDADHRHPELSTFTGNGMMMAIDAGQGVIAQRNGEGRIRVHIALRTAEDWHRTAGADLADPAAVRAVLLARFSDWGAPLLAFLRAADTGYVNRPLYALPVPHTWRPTAGVTLLGDAAHLMSPISGMGANLAMRDGADLAHALLDHVTTDAAVAAYEKVLFPRSAEAAQGAAAGLADLFSPDGAAHVLAHMSGEE
ncbi:FAD-dependent oxidoreductase [Streptomyces sp. NPDC002067]